MYDFSYLHVPLYHQYSTEENKNIHTSERKNLHFVSGKYQQFFEHNCRLVVDLTDN